MARLNDDAQWIVLMGFLVSFSFFFLALVINQATVVGQTTAESVIEFPKNDIRDVRDVIIRNTTLSGYTVVNRDITAISMSKKSAVVSYHKPNDNTILFYNCIPGENFKCTTIHYNNGVTEYNENWISL